MNSLTLLAKILVSLGILLLFLGGLFYLASKTPGLDRLPGELVEAMDASTNTPVALKFSFPPSSRRDARVKLFARVSEYLLRMSHPKLIKGIELQKFGQRFCLVMELATQGNLANFISRKGRIGEEEGIKIITQVIEGLIYIHSCGFIHRDIKPRNILLFENNIAKVSDFDLLIPMGGKGRGKSILPTGSPSYMSPEQIRGKELTVTSDIYALGITMYEMFTGRVPFSGGSVHEVMNKALNSQPLSPQELNHQLSPSLEKVVLKCIAKEPEQRFSSLESLKRSLFLDK